MKAKPLIGIMEMQFVMVLFLLGSAIILGIGLDAGEYSWLANLLAGITGLFLFNLYVYIWNENRHQSLNFILIAQFGRHIGFIISIVYAVYFAYIASRVLNDIVHFINSTLLHNMHPFFIKFTIFIIIIYTYSKGLEPFVRSAVIFGLVTISFLMLIPFFIVLSGNFHIDYILPFHSLDVKKIVRTVFPALVTFPYGELIVFLALLPFLKEKKALVKGGSIVIVISAILLSIFSFLTIGVLHPDLAKSYSYPLVTTIEHIGLIGFFQRLDIMAVIIFMIGCYFKITVFTFASIFVAKDCTAKWKMNHKSLVSAIFIVIIALSYLYSDNNSLHVKIGLELVPALLHVPLQIVVPALIVMFTFVRGKLA
ncbi:GerAB/ArcD/ProY family transporter [Peribacillus sp. SI8-4]|uniref:GerAB/ArcD/ProY family transporter n=1 Tax=Peribacillus sp. SI8-4 TaxID=3048009 RepID=UPI0025564A62|nr:GerAB/ArcD/ProY family transporter [Peribacillus sp. SI8-4]